MHSICPKLRQSCSHERGFTLPELLLTIAMIGILLGIAIPMWSSVVESRRVDSAANQLVSDLRLAHTRATNQLTSYEVTLVPGSSDYKLGGDPRSLPEDTVVRSAEAESMMFRAAGDVAPEDDGTLMVEVGVEDGGPLRKIEVNTVTSRIEALP